MLDLKTGHFTHADAGQINLYLNYAKESLTRPGEANPVGIILCSAKDDAVVRYATAGIQTQVFASQYPTKLPDAKNRDKVHPSQIVVIINDKSEVQIGSYTVPISQASDQFKTLQEQTGHVYKSVIIKADPNANYGTVLQVMDAAKSQNLTDFGLANHIEGSKT